MERILIKNINRQLDNRLIKEYIIDNNVYNINYHIKEPYRKKLFFTEPIIEPQIIEKPIIVIKKRDMNELRNKIKKYLENKKQIHPRFVSPIEIVQEKILTTNLLIDFNKIQDIYNKTRTIPLTLFKNATFNDLLIYLPNNFDPFKYYQINKLEKISTPDSPSFVRDMEYHYLKYGRFKRLLFLDKIEI